MVKSENKKPELKEAAGDNQTRRDFFKDSFKKSVVIGVPLILTLKNRSAFANTDTASGNLSGNLSGGNESP